MTAPAPLTPTARPAAGFAARADALLAQLRPDLGQIHVDDAGHNVHHDQPERVAAQLLHFLT